MNQETRYRYQKKIRELEKHRDDAVWLRLALNDIQSAADEALREGKTVVHLVYLLRAFKKVWRQ